MIEITDEEAEHWVEILDHGVRILTNIARHAPRQAGRANAIRGNLEKIADTLDELLEGAE